MPLRIRCPHCRHVLVVGDKAAGLRTTCPDCGGVFNAPLPSAAVPEATDLHGTLAQCPRCGAEVAPLGDYCRRCFTDLVDGRRLTWKRRLRLVPARFWVLAACGVLAFAVLVSMGVAVYRIRARPVTAPFAPTTPAPLPAPELAAALLNAPDATARAAALQRLAGVEMRAAPAVADALKGSLDSSAGGPQTVADRVAAIDLLARHGTSHPAAVASWVETLARCQDEPGLREAALRARAILGDARVLDDLVRTWLDKLRRFMFLGRLVAVARADREPAAHLVLTQGQAELTRCADGLRYLGQNPDNLMFERLAQSYWESWCWLGQGPGDSFLAELFALAKPRDGSLTFKPEDIRTPRDVMKRVAQRGSPAARAAAGMALYNVPQYRSASQQVCDTLAELLPTCDAVDQQRLTWVLAQLRGKLFGPVARQNPLDVSAAEIAVAEQWARPGTPPVLDEPYPTPPALTYRALTAERQLEQELLRALQAGWSPALPALERWLAGGLGSTPRIHALLSPGQRQPDYPAVAAALVIAAVRDDEALRPQLELWRGAADQPPWVRALAYTVLGRFDARTGRWSSGWPAGLDVGDTTLLDRGAPGWDHFGRVLGAGGAVMRQRLLDESAETLPAEIRSRLLEAADRCARGGGP